MSVTFQFDGEPWGDEPTIQIGICDEGSYFVTVSVNDAEKFVGELKSEIEYTRKLRAAKDNHPEKLRLIAERAGFPDARSWIAANFKEIEKMEVTK